MSRGAWLRRLAFVLVPIGTVLGVSYAFMRSTYPQLYGDTTVYSVSYARPVGWKEVPPGPFTLFVFRHPEGKGTLRASVNEVQARYNPTPELDTEGIAQHYLDITDSNMPEWKAERKASIKSATEEFSLIKRSKSDKTVYTAFCSKGNTTIVVSLYAGGEAAKAVDALLPEFHKLVCSFKLTPKAIQFDD